MQNQLQFKISAALKNIIGSDLISDDFIAVFELVKNSYDAHATKVEIEFLNINSPSAKILIKDNGKGMNYDDLLNKWLFVAYSAKKEGTEEDGYDYRNRIKVKRAYAGAKGIGRFSCDRLGRNLYLETLKDEPNAKAEVLYTDWDKFEGDIKDEFVNISVLHETKSQSSYNINHGTVLEISELKSDWDRQKFLSLKDALAKLINPNTRTKDDVFEIILNVPEQIENDNEQSSYSEIVNGKVQNLIFETLEIKTTKIQSIVSDKSLGIIETSLFEGGKLVYKITEKNSYQNLHNVESELYYLNQSAKSTFTRRMNVQPVEYGHVFVYKNGLRIYPYGERGEDPFKMDNRKAQGYSRYIGTREILGFISVNEPNDNLKETSSRGDGFIKTKDYLQLVEWFYENLRRLEKYVIDIVDWGNELSSDDYINLTDEAKQTSVKSLITNLSKSKNLIDFEVSPEIFEIIHKKQEGSTKNTLDEITKQLESDNFDKDKLLRELKSTGKKFDELKKYKDEAEDEAFKNLIENENLSENLEKELKKGAFQGALIGTDKERIISMQHQVFHSSSRIHRNLKLLTKKLDPKTLDETTKKYIKVISLETSKINSIANFITKANFNLKASEIETEVVDFISDYLHEVYIHEDAVIDTNLKITVEKNNLSFESTIRPLEVTTVLDCFISNSEKSGATNLKFIFNKTSSEFQLSIEDNGKGIDPKNINEIFDLGYTTTNGSGIGLYQVHDIIVNKMNGSIEVKSELKKGTTFKITI